MVTSEVKLFVEEHNDGRVVVFARFDSDYKLELMTFNKCDKSVWYNDR